MSVAVRHPPGVLTHSRVMRNGLAHAVAPIALWRGELRRAADMTELLLTRSEEHGLFIWHAMPGGAGSSVARVEGHTKASERGSAAFRDQSRDAAALDLLFAVHDRFTEGFATADLIRPASLLAELRSSR